MGRTRTYGSWSRTMLTTLRSRELLKVEALVAWLSARGVEVDRSLVSHWCAGRTHLPADLLPLLAEFTRRPEEVFGEYVRAVDYEIVPLPVPHTTDADIIDLVLIAGAQLGRLQHALAEARAPDSPGGVVITPEERLDLRAHLDELIHLLADVRSKLPLDGGTA